MAATAEIQWYDRTRDGVVEYFIKVNYNGTQWSIKKRYSEFSVLNDYLLKHNVEIPVELPPKYTFRRHDSKMLAKRRKQLQAYIDGLLNRHALSGNRFLKEFLDVDMGLLGFTLSNNRKHNNVDMVDVMYKLQHIPDKFAKDIIKFYSHTKNYSNSPIQQQAHSNGSFSANAPVQKASFTMLRTKSKSLSFSTSLIYGGGGNSTHTKANHADSFSSRPSLSPTPIATATSSFSNNNNSVHTQAILSALHSHSYAQPVSPHRKNSMGMGGGGGGGGGVGDYFLLGLNIVSSSDQQKAIQRRKQYIQATNNIWSHYVDDIRTKCERYDQVCVRKEKVDLRVIEDSEYASVWKEEVGEGNSEDLTDNRNNVCENSSIVWKSIEQVLSKYSRQLDRDVEE
eukprot:gene28541-34453_t